MDLASRWNLGLGPQGPAYLDPFSMKGDIETAITLLTSPWVWCFTQPTCPQGLSGLWVKFPLNNPHGSRALVPGF